MREKFFILMDLKICVEDASGTEVDESVFAEMATQNGICFIIQDGNDNVKLTINNAFYYYYYYMDGQGC